MPVASTQPATKANNDERREQITLLFRNREKRVNVRLTQPTSQPTNINIDFEKKMLFFRGAELHWMGISDRQPLE